MEQTTAATKSQIKKAAASEVLTAINNHLNRKQMYIQRDYDSEPEFFPDPPEEDYSEWRQRKQHEADCQQLFEALQENPNLLNQPDLPF